MTAHGHHSPIVLLARLGTRWLVVAVVLFVLTSPVTLGVAMALLDHFTGQDFGSRFFGFG